MALFVVIPDVFPAEPLETKIREKFGNASLRLSRGDWLVSYDGTSKQLSDDLLISEGEIGIAAIVLAFDAYWGRTSTAVWEWIALHQTKL